ncbi:MAG TPA: hypothetical protein VKT30_18315 [Caulobacteraceae bacterium]|nr:hypothetical protein [Caulobacteraceae bacterium]
MSRVPRLLPLVGIAIGGVLAVKAVTAGPQIWGATAAFAEDVVHPGQKSPLPPGASILGAANGSAAGAAGPHAAVCAPTAAELAKEAGLSPAELQVLQSLSNRRGELDQREMSLDTQVQLIAAAEAKLDSRIQGMNQLKTDIQALLGQADQQQQAEQQRLVRIYEDMDPKKAAAAMTVMDDSVRVPIAAAMKERKLAAILQAMQPADAKALTEKLAQRMANSQLVANAKAALNGSQPPAGAPAASAAAAAPPSQAAPAAQTTTAAADQGKAAKVHPTARRVARAKATPRRGLAGDSQAASTSGTGQTGQPKTAPPVPPDAKIG